MDELYPKVSPDGARICFQADEGKGDSKVRNVYLMNSDGAGRIKIADQAREPCWSADGKQIAYLPNELDKFTYADGATKGIRIYDCGYQTDPRTPQHRDRSPLYPQLVAGRQMVRSHHPWRDGIQTRHSGPAG